MTGHHSEDFIEIYLPFPLPYLRVRSEGLLPNWMKSGTHVEFESAQFNSSYDVYAGVAKFAYDVIHPRQVERPKPRPNGGTLSPSAIDSGGLLTKCQPRSVNERI